MLVNLVKLMLEYASINPVSRFAQSSRRIHAIVDLLVVRVVLKMASLLRGLRSQAPLGCYPTTRCHYPSTCR